MASAKEPQVFQAVKEYETLVRNGGLRLYETRRVVFGGKLYLVDFPSETLADMVFQTGSPFRA